MLVRFVSTDYSSLILYVRFEDGGEVTSLWALLGRRRLSPAPAVPASARAERSVPAARRVWAPAWAARCCTLGPLGRANAVHTVVCTPRASPPSPARCVLGASWGSESQGRDVKTRPHLPWGSNITALSHMGGHMGPKPTEVREGPGGDPWGEGGIEEGLGVFAPHHGSSASSQKRAWGPRVAGGVPEAHQGVPAAGSPRLQPGR